jgi:hypothetical protein
MMKLDFLKEGNDDCPMLRLYDFRSSDVQHLIETFEALASGTTQQASLEDVCPVESVDGARLRFTRGERDRGVVRQGVSDFEVILTGPSWEQAAGLAEPFCRSSLGYQWLTPRAGKIQLLLSPTGDW